MTDTPDFAALAREYLDLWEDQLAAMAADPTLAAQSAQFFETMGQAGSTAAPQATAQMAALAQQFMTLAGLATGGTPNNDDTKRAPPRTAAPAAAPDNSAQQLAELTSRLTALEKRLDRLEAGGGGARGGAKPAARKRTTAKPKQK
ncbi:MAG: hypothetical protein OER92_03425 [Alphaproteobacteria bacterium]|nr:hypothetical protein [Alphaproteobacteria bacterium]